jgi:hypothetical protein
LCIYSVMMNSIEWPKAILPEASSHVLLPELELTDADYAVAADALRQLEDCFSEVVFVHEVAARHCRERQLNAELARRSGTIGSQHARSKDFIKQAQEPTPINHYDSFGKQFNRAKK